MRPILRKAHNIITAYYQVLLVCLILLFILRPHSNEIYYVAIWKFFLSSVILSAVFNVKHNDKVRIIASCLALPTIILAWLDLAYPCPLFFISNAVLTSIFLFLCTCSILFDVVLRAKVTLETLRGVICAYFMIAFAFAYSYYLIEYIFPNSFHLIGSPASIYNYAHYFSQLLYFSFVTLLTIGYGDITAVKSAGQTLTVLEGIIGQFYIAILVARLVSVYSSYADDRVIKLLHEFTKAKKEQDKH
jgi:voltage-gated potassium channel